MLLPTGSSGRRAALTALLVAPETFMDGVGNLTEEGGATPHRPRGAGAAGAIRGLSKGASDSAELIGRSMGQRFGWIFLPVALLCLVLLGTFVRRRKSRPPGPQHTEPGKDQAVAHGKLIGGGSQP